MGVGGRRDAAGRPVHQEQVTASGLIQINARSGEASETLSTARTTRVAAPPALSSGDMLTRRSQGNGAGR
jgi:hypothetical protein